MKNRVPGNSHVEPVHNIWVRDTHSHRVPYFLFDFRKAGAHAQHVLAFVVFEDKTRSVIPRIRTSLLRTDSGNVNEGFVGSGLEGATYSSTVRQQHSSLMVRGKGEFTHVSYFVTFEKSRMTNKRSVSR